MVNVGNLNPKISMRLLSKRTPGLYHFDDIETERKRILASIKDEQVSGFRLEQFISGDTALQQLQTLKTLYRRYLEEIALIEEYCGQNRNAAQIIFNSVTTKSSELSYKEAVSYFGHIPPSNYNRIVKAAQELRSVSTAPVEHSLEEFGSDLEFNRPSLLIKPLVSVKLNDAAPSVDGVNMHWLISKCISFIQSSQSSFDENHLCMQIITACRNGSDTSEELESVLFDLLGEAGIDLMMDVMENKSQIACLTPCSPPTASSANRTINISSTPNESASYDWLQHLGFGDDHLLQERALGLQKGAPKTGHFVENWMDNLAPQGTSEYHEKRGLPAGAEKRVGPGYEEVHIPAAKKATMMASERLIDIADIEDGWARLAFAGTTRLNRIQSQVFNCAYKTSENMLICAPTGAGKTNIAMLAFLQLVRQHVSAGHIDGAAIKAVYIAPMKALAQEVVTKFSERLRPLGLVVKEFTGDMQLTKQEVLESQLLVCTPEKYDVVTRKGGEGSLGTLVSLIIIDEVHLLADDRGAVIETIVARTQRYVETSQKFVRIVGLSATLPNYQDVGTFLRVNPKSGLFHFGPEYRPIPLDQTLVGITEKQRMKRNDLMNKHAYDKMVHALECGKQVMIFVHARKETSRTAEAIVDLNGKFGTTHLFENAHHEHYTLFKRQVDKSRSVEVQQLFAKGLGVHHAGMLRADRTLTEQLFECGLIKLLCCTSTLAWGVNLPAHTVIIKGTELYDPERGGFVDLSILDVLQIFGRAGRPQYDSTGHAIMITSHASLNPYLGMLTHQAPIESGLIKSLADHLNAEIVNGTVSNIKEAASWLSYTFLFVRMCRNPMAYGIKHEEVFVDPRLEAKRMDLVRQAAELLDNCMMVRFDRRSGNLGVTDLGRIASHYYIKHGTIEAFNNMLTPHLSDPDAMHVLCSSAEFDQLKVRPEELVEIDSLKKELHVKVKTAVEDTAGKVNVLLQGYMSQCRVSSFTLQSDTNYVAQNTGRIARALFEICLKRGWSTMAGHYLALCKAIDRRMRMDQSPLRQFEEVPREAIKRIEETGSVISKLLDLGVKEVGQLVHNQKAASTVLRCARFLPQLRVEAQIQPITRGILKLSLSISSDFEWNDRYHGHAQPFWIWVEDGDNEYIYHSEYFVLLRKLSHETKVIEFTIPVREPLPPQYYIRTVSDSWVGCEAIVALSFKDLVLPSLVPTHTDLLPVHPVPKTALGNPSFEALYSFTHFNPIQSQTFHALFHTDHNVLVGAPTGSGKTITAEMAIFRLKTTRPGAKTIYVAPLKALARERLADWRKKLGGLGMCVLELTGDVTPNVDDLRRADVLIVTPEKWDSISRGWQKRDYVKRVELVIIDEIHLLGVDRGPVLEIIVSRMRFIAAQTASPIRFVGLSTALANPRDLADWLGIGDVGVYNFRPSVRPIPMTIHISGFPGKHYCPRMATMNKPTYAAILEHSPEKPALVFVSSRRQTRLTALDLISFCAADDDPKQFLHMPEDEVAAIASTLRDRALRDTIVFGIAIHHAGLDNHDRSVVEELFYSGKVQVLVCTSTLAWGVNLPCHLVVVKGTEFFDAKQGRYVDFPVTDVLQMMGRAGRPQFDDSGVACVLVHEPKKTFYRKFLHEPFPVESSLQHQLHEHLNAEIVGGTVTNVRDCVEYLTWTYFFRRLVVNPSYYGLVDASPSGVQQHLNALSVATIRDLRDSECVLVNEDEDLCATVLGRIASYYYLHYRTVGVLKTSFVQLPADITIEKCVENAVFIMSNALEFSELPVRHNEDQLNAELARSLPWPSDRLAMDSPHTKTFLLLQAHFGRRALPISDYVNDTKSVLDQVPRVLNAMMEIAVAETPKLVLLLALVKVSQMLMQGLWDHESELKQLRNLSSGSVESLTRCNIHTLKDLLALSPSGISQLLGTPVAKQTVDSLAALPVVSVDSAVLRQHSGAELETSLLLPSSLTAVNLVANKQCELVCTLRCRSDGSKMQSRHKSQAVTWWLVLATQSGEVLCVRKASHVGSRHPLSVSLVFALPTCSIADGSEGSHLVLRVLCDAVMGLDLQLVFPYSLQQVAR